MLLFLRALAGQPWLRVEDESHVGRRNMAETRLLTVAQASAILPDMSNGRHGMRPRWLTVWGISGRRGLRGVKEMRCAR